MSHEEQLEKLKYEYNEVFQKLEIPDPNKIDKCINDLTKSPVITIGNIFVIYFEE